jgi:hypothetical protein
MEGAVIRGPLTLVAMLLAATTAVAGSMTDFTLGLRAEYIGEQQEIEGAISEQSTLRAAIFLAFDGYLSDPRALSFSGFVEQAATDSEWTESGTTVQSRTDDYTYDQTFYSLGFRALSALPVSLGAGARRVRDDLTGPARGGLVAGLETSWYGDLYLTPFRSGGATLSYLSNEFEADDPETLRDRTQTTARLTADGRGRLIDGRLDVRHEELGLFSGLQQQELDVGYLDLAFNRGGKDQFQTIFSGNRVRVARSGSEPTDWTTVWKAHSAYTHSWDAAGFLRGYADYQQNTGPAGDLLAWVGGLTLVRSLSRTVAIDAETSYLRAEDELGGVLDQPVASAGVTWTLDSPGWSLVLHPRVSYIRVSDELDNTSSSTGEQLFASIRRHFRGGFVGVEGEYAGNQLSIASSPPGGVGGGATFLAGLEKEREWVRLIVSAQPSARTGIYASGEGRRVVRLDLGNEVTADTGQARLSLRWRTFTLGGGLSVVDLVGGDLPSMTTTSDAGIMWSPWHWLSFDGRAYRERREAEGSTGELEWAEIGVRFLYARLSFFARVRDETSYGDGAQLRDYRRYWVGVQRTFGFGLGGRTGRRPTGWETQ